MKLMLNGALTIGTLDGANIEIRDAAGEDNFFLFGMTKQEVLDRRANGYKPEAIVKQNAELKRVMDFVSKGFMDYSFSDLANNIMYQDPYLVLADFDAYAAAQRLVSRTYSDAAKWNEMSAMNIAGAGVFSADRAVREYAENIWNIKPVQ